MTKTGYGRSGYCSLNSQDSLIEDWIRGVMKQFIERYTEDELPYWLLKGGRDPKKIDAGNVTIAVAGGLNLVKH